MRQLTSVLVVVAVLGLLGASVAQAEYALGFNTVGETLDGWAGPAGCVNNDGSPDGYSWCVGGVTATATGSAVLGSDTITEGNYMIDFKSAVTGGNATAPTAITLTAKSTNGVTLGSEALSMSQISQTWGEHSLDFSVPGTSAAIGNYLKLEFSVAPTHWYGIDTITSSVTPLPEPSTLVLLTVGLFGLLAYAWRKRK